MHSISQHNQNNLLFRADEHQNYDSIHIHVLDCELFSVYGLHFYRNIQSSEFCFRHCIVSVVKNCVSVNEFSNFELFPFFSNNLRYKKRCHDRGGKISISVIWLGPYLIICFSFLWDELCQIWRFIAQHVWEHENVTEWDKLFMREKEMVFACVCLCVRLFVFLFSLFFLFKLGFQLLTLLMRRLRY